MDDATEFQILDRHSFGRFLGLPVSQKIPDATTIWRFREDLVKAGIVAELFATFDTHLRDNGFMAMKGSIVDAGIVNVPKQLNCREENARIGNLAYNLDRMVRPSSGIMAKERHRALSETLQRCENNWINRQKSIVFVKKNTGEIRRRLLN